MELKNLRVVGVLTWAIVGIPPLMWELKRNTMATPRALGWMAAYLLFVVLFWCASKAGCSRVRRWTFIPFQTLCCAICLALSTTGFLAVLLVLVAAQVGSDPVPIALSWITFQTILLVIILWQVGQSPVANAMAYFGFQLFALHASRVAFSEAEARQKLAVAHAELQVATGILEINSRSEERLRIARDLHDLLGHHLTALSLNLEVATHLTTGAAREHVEKSHALTRVLLSDVREVVSQLRDREPVDLVQAVRVLADVVATPKIHVELPERINVSDLVGQTALRMLQEIVTNAVRHSSARNLRLSLAQQSETLTIVGSDDGVGTDMVRYGHGLEGMRERAQEAGGRFEVQSSRGAGFSVRIQLPTGAGA